VFEKERAGARGGCWWQHHEWQVEIRRIHNRIAVSFIFVQGEWAACGQSIFRRLQLQVFNGGEPGIRLALSHFQMDSCREIAT
jgi:hypothetical protein